MGAARRIVGGLGALLLLLSTALFWMDTGPGHRFVAAQIAHLEPRNGLRIQLTRIDGSLYGKAQLVGLRLSDLDGVFFEAPRVDLDWSPWAWGVNRLDIRRLSASTARLHRLPRLRPSPPGTPMLPSFDVSIGALVLDRLDIGKGVSGQPQRGRLTGAATLRDGDARIDLAVLGSAGDLLLLHLDAVPEVNRLALNLALDAPARGVFAALLGAPDPLVARIEGAGDWARWQGRFDLRRAGRPAANLALMARAGRFSLSGRIGPSALPAGRLRALAGPGFVVSGTSLFARRRLTGDIALASPALRLSAAGGVSLATSSFDDLLVTARVRQPQVLLPRMAGGPVTATIRLDGPFRSAYFDYLVTAPLARFGATGIEGLRASGRGRLSRAPVRVPLRLSARRVTGVGDVAGGLLANISVDGNLLATSRTVLGEGLQLRSDKLNGKIAVFVDLAQGRFDIGLAGQVARLLIPGIGLVDVKSTLEVVPGPAGRGVRILGRGEAWVRRFDNRFFAGLMGGLPRLETGLERTPDGALRFTNMRIISPGLSAVLSGVRRRDGSFALEGAGRQTRYGPFRLTLDGPLARPRIALVLARPNAALGLEAVSLQLVPMPQGFDWRAVGGSRLGRFEGRGQLLLLPGRPARINVAELAAGGALARGGLVAVAGGLQGSLTLSGAASGTLGLDVANDVQRVRADVELNNVRFDGSPALGVARGRFNGTVLLDPRGPQIAGTASARGVSYGSFGIARLSGTVRLAGGVGEIRSNIAGSRGRDFDLATTIRLDSGRVAISGSGTIDGRPVALVTPATLQREGAGWRLAPVELTYAGGQASLSGRIGGPRPEISAVLTSMPLVILDTISPRLGLGGRASGTLSYSEDADGSPTGRMDVKVRGLSRAGLSLASRPIDLAVVASFGKGRAGARLVAASGGQTIGRGQVQLTGLGGPASLATQLTNATVFGQLRYQGDAGTLWRMSGIETFDVSGNVAIGADVAGRLADPVIRGSVRTTTARVESAGAGMVLTNVAASGRFDGARLVFDSFTATAGRGGKVSGSGTINFAEQDRGLDISVAAEAAQLIARDDLGATVTGPIRLRSDGSGGTISGTVRLVRSSYVLGRSAAVAAVPKLKVREINGDPQEEALAAAAPAQPWMLDIRAEAPGQMMVSGMGLDSEWRANLDIKGSVYAPAVTGTAEMVRGGYEFAGRRFELQRGVLRFRGESPPDPILDIVAQGDTQGLSATIRVTGTGLKPEISFASVPALPQDELLSRLLFGTSITNLSAPEAVQLAAAVASMRGGGGLNPINALRKAVGLDRLRILPADTVTGQRTSVAAGKYLTRRTFVEVITDGQGYSATRAEFQVTRWLSILSTISTIGEQSGAIRVSKDY